MRRFIKHILIFIPVAMVTYVVLVILWGSLVSMPYLKKNLNYKRGLYGHMYSRLQEVEQIKDVDILFLGSSHAYRGFDIRMFERYGYKSFNLGSSSQTPMQSQYLITRYGTALNPKTIVYEVNPDIFESDGVESTLDLLSNASVDRSLLTFAAKIKDIRLFNTAIYAYYKSIRDRDQSFHEPRQQGVDRYISGGYVERDLWANAPSSFTRLHNDTNPKQWQSFKEMMVNFEARNIRVILVQAPVRKSYYNGYVHRKDFDQRMSRYNSYYNFNLSKPYKDDLFYDDQHLNQNGVKQFNEELIDLINIVDN